MGTLRGWSSHPSQLFLFSGEEVFVYLFVWDMDSLYSPGYPSTLSVDQSGLELWDPIASASQV